MSRCQGYPLCQVHMWGCRMSKIGTAMLRNKFNSMVMIKSGIFSHLHPPYSTTKLLGPQLSSLFQLFTFCGWHRLIVSGQMTK